MTVRRGDSTLNLTAKLRELPIDAGKPTETADATGQIERGMQVEALTSDARQQLKLSKEAHGVVASQLDPSSPAATAGVQEGDVIQEVDRHAVNTVSEFEQAMHAASGKPVLLRVTRNGTGL